jgi:DNA-binding transcriptional LysR family regulator
LARNISYSDKAPAFLRSVHHRILPPNGSYTDSVGLRSVIPEIDLRVSATMHHVDFAREDVDVAVRHGDGKWTGLEVVRLCSERLFPVCSPKLVSRRNRMTTAADLLKFPLLRLNDWNTWRRWFEAAGVPANQLAHGPTLNSASMLIDAAVDGRASRLLARPSRRGISSMAVS